jgi:hypothetical protein
MDCLKIEQWLSEYMESSLAAEEMSQVTKHIESCRRCSALLDEMRSIVSTCHSYPVLEMDPDFLERILLRTSGRPRTRSFKERLDQYLTGALLTPRFGVGASLAILFLAMMVNLMMPRMPAVLSAVSPSGLFRLMDRGVQKIYGEGLKAYDKKAEWQDQFTRFKNNTLNNLRFMLEQIEVPVEGRKKSEEPAQDKQRTPGDKISRLSLRPA